MADLSELLKSKKVGEFVRQSKSRPWTIDQQSSSPPKPSVASNEITIKPRTNLEQSQNKLGTKLDHNPEQSQNKLGTTENQEKAPALESQNKVRSQPRTEPRTNLEQSQNKLGTKVPFSSVVGLQRKIVLFVFDATKTSREKMTAPIAIQNLADACQTTSMAAQVTTRRLEKKGLLGRAGYKNGRGGWSRYELPNDLFQELLQLETQNKLGTNIEQTQNKVRSQPRTEPRTSVSSSSSFLDLENFKTTTTGEPELFESASPQLSPEWLSVDTISLVDIGFTQTHLIQIIRQGKLSPAEVQDSIHFFTFDLKRNGKGSELNGSPLNFFMGILRKGIPYAPPENYESPADEARRKTREFKERKEQERLAEEDRIMELEFSEWKSKLSVDELATLVPEYARKPGRMQDGALRTYFNETIWLNRQAKSLALPALDPTEVGKQIDQALEEARG